MRKLLLAGVAALGLGLCFIPTDASAAWVTRTAYRWDPACHRYVAYPVRTWVPDCGRPHHFHGRHYRRR
jgi:hypothetical protein